MASLEEIRAGRLEKLELLRKNGIDPYPAKTKREISLAQIVERFDGLAASEKPVIAAGRIMSIRGQGGLVFFHLYDGTAKFQALLKKEDL
jgi:lysyl-tRNA synthetase class 2